MKDKLVSLEDAAGLIADGTVLGIGGSTLRRHPMALIREIARQGRRNLEVQTWLGGIDVDLLVGAGCVTKVEAAYLGLGPLGLSPNVKRAVANGALDIDFHTESTMIARFRAGAEGLPFYPTNVVAGTGFEDSPAVMEMEDPFTGRRVHALRPARPDVTILHGYSSDDAGNIQTPARKNKDDIDTLLASAANRVIVTVEKIVSRGSVRKNPHSTYIPHTWVEAVVEVPYGAHPGTCDTKYEQDPQSLDDYLQAAQTQDGFEAWLHRHVLEPRDHFEYLERSTTLERLASLSYPEEI